MDILNKIVTVSGGETHGSISAVVACVVIIAAVLSGKMPNSKNQDAKALLVYIAFVIFAGIFVTE